MKINLVGNHYLVYLGASVLTSVFGFDLDILI